MNINIKIIIVSIIIGTLLWINIADMYIRYSWIDDKQTYIYESFKNLDLKCE